MYVYSAVAQVRSVLAGLVTLAKAGNVAASYILGRHIFEWAAHACYVGRNLRNYIERQEWERAWKLLSTAAIGNLWLNQHGAKYAEQGFQPPAVPNPLTVANVNGAYENYLSQEYDVQTVQENYGLLSELSHPNAACLQQHQVHLDGGRETEIADAEPISPLPFVNWCLLDFLVFMDSLLGMVDETDIQPRINGVLAEIKERAPVSRKT